MPSASLVIPTFNRAEMLEIALRTVGALRRPRGWRIEVLVMDNNSQDRTAAVVASLQDAFPFPLRRVIEPKQGLNHARNRGMQEAGGDWLVYLDDDIRMASGWLEAFADAVQRLEPDAVVGPVLPWFEGEVPSWCTGRVLDSVTSAYSRKGDRLLIVPRDRAHELPGCNFAVRLRLAREVGGFHPALDRSGDGMLAGGDFEFGKRLRRCGARVVYVPGCRVDHFVSRGKMSKIGLRQRWYGLGQTERAIAALLGEQRSGRQKLRALARLARFEVRACLQRYRAPHLAFRWELEALRLRGALFGDVSAFAAVETELGAT
ncbi:MAG TPA: glycosyltransferase [Afifellaceae bacterium]|nr:glycosyltransferase [Afifellaceae bacterium]